MVPDQAIDIIARSGLDNRIAPALLRLNAFHLDSIRALLINLSNQLIFTQKVNSIQKSEFNRNVLLECIVSAIVAGEDELVSKLMNAY